MNSDKQIRILLLEDRLEDAEIISRELRSRELNFQMIHALDKTAFIENITASNPDIILSDYSLPGYSGLEALNDSLKEKPDVPFLIVTGSINEEDYAWQ